MCPKTGPRVNKLGNLLVRNPPVAQLDNSGFTNKCYHPKAAQAETDDVEHT